MVLYDICIFLSGLFHLVWQSLGSSMLLQMVLFPSVYGWAIFHCICIPHLLYPFRVWRKRNPPTLLVSINLISLLECINELVQSLWRTTWKFLKKLKIELTYNSGIPFLSIYLKKTRTPIHTRTPMFIAALFTIAKTWKQSKCPMADESILLFQQW